LISGLNSNAETGISESEVKNRQAVYGTNSFPPPKIATLCELIMENFNDPINVILIAAAIVSLIIGIIKEGFPEGLTEGISIMVALVIIFVVNSANNYASERQLANMVMMADVQNVDVFRGTTESVTKVNDDLVVGDIIKFKEGMKLPADCVMIDGQDVTCSETELTGEPDSLEKVVVT